MPKFYDSIPDDLAEWALDQSVFFTASAPLYGSHVNVSPKGYPQSTFAILGPNQAVYLDATGSGSETISHVYENGRVTIMFCSHEKGPRIMRFFCKGTVIEYDDSRFHDLIHRMGKAEHLIKGARAVILLDIFKVQTSCGFGVPLVNYSSPSHSTIPSIAEPTQDGASEPKASLEFSDRSTMNDWAQKMSAKNALVGYQAEWNSKSLDGLPGLRAAMRDHGDVVWWEEIKQRAKAMAWGQRDGVALGILIGAFLMWIYSQLEEAKEPR